MKVQSSHNLVSMLCVAALLGGCSSSSSSTPDDEVLDDPADVSTDTETVTGSGAGIDPVTDSGIDPVTDSGIDPETDNPPASRVDMLIPDVAPGSDLERLLTGLKRQVSATFLDLNQRLSQGVELTDQQANCLGAFDPVVGELLLAIDCEQALATGDVDVDVDKAAFYDTDECQASLFNGHTDNCQLQRAGINLPDLFTVPDGQRRPLLVHAGTSISYALTDFMLRIESSEPAIAGPFRCDIDLASGDSSAPLSGSSCASIVASTADYLDEVVPR